LEEIQSLRVKKMGNKSFDSVEGKVVPVLN
jgi:hypothetical protein